MMVKKSKRQKNKDINKVGEIQSREITEEMKKSYIDYAMSVIVSRALPDVRDGLKPVQRRILYAMYEDGLRSDTKFRKSATTVGNTMSRYHPHGDAAIYNTLARMTQDFSLRYPLIDGQGNFGSIDGDSPAAYRYTEARLSKVGEEMLQDIKKETVDFLDNYDGTKKEPAVLPSPLPQLLLNGSLGIAVGMATSIPPHNLSEVCDALVYLIDNPKSKTEDLLKLIKGPDFPTGGEIFNKEEILQAYSQGKGSIITRGKAEVVETKKGRRILITEIPYQVNKSSLVEQLAILVREKKIQRIRDIRDESDKEGMRIVVDLQNNANPKRVLNRLFKFSYLQRRFYLNMIALVDGIQPKVLSLRDLLSYFLVHRKEIVVRKTKFDLKKAKERVHILEGLVKCLGRIDDVIKTIKKSANREAARKNLMRRFKLTSLQANAILETKLSALAKLETKKIKDELKELQTKIKELTAILTSKKKIMEVMKKEVIDLKERFGDERRTKVYTNKLETISLEDLIPRENTIISLTHGGYIKRSKPSVYKSQRRGGKGILGMKTIDHDFVEHFILANTHDFLLFFTDTGKVFKIPAYEIPKGNRLAKGRGILNFLELSPNEKVLSIFALEKKKEGPEEKYLVMATKNGIIKKTKIEEFENIRRSGLRAISLKKEDVLRKVEETSGSDEIIFVTKKGQSIRFKEEEIRAMGRQASGVKGIRLKKGDEVVGMEMIKKEIKKKVDKVKMYLLVVTENGYGKRTDLKEYKIQKRGGMGIKTANLTSKTGPITSSKLLTDEKELIAISQKGQVIRTKISQISKFSRATQGVKIMKLEKEDKVASTICF